jgi:hypothetical protein
VQTLTILTGKGVLVLVFVKAETFRQFNYEKALMIMGLTILGSAILLIFIVIEGQNTMLSCKKKNERNYFMSYRVIPFG